MEQAISGLAAKLKQNPDDAEGWALLGRAYLKQGQPATALRLLEHARPREFDEDLRTLSVRVQLASGNLKTASQVPLLNSSLVLETNISCLDPRSDIGSHLGPPF